MDYIVVIMAGILVLVVAVVVGLGAWLLVRVTSLMRPIQAMLEKQSFLIDKLVTIVVAKGPMEYSAIRAADSLVSYDDDSTSAEEAEEPEDGEEAYNGSDRAAGEGTGDPFIDGTFD